ncbi:hypothetical protein HYC85_012267 [Camellia sinensis]|uniref:Uncharacterized protein n=1 Tax=Camellia sinensis TaxID=4442 RepID=A0A7J7HED9_CAMSI|nr:hypothetical protein HYC85_012267 [Camellia sinensis]
MAKHHQKHAEIESSHARKYVNNMGTAQTHFPPIHWPSCQIQLKLMPQQTSALHLHLQPHRQHPLSQISLLKIHSATVPFRALPSTDGVTAPPPTHNISTSSFDPIANQSSELTQPFGDTFPGMSPDAQLLSTNAQFSPPEVDILADILPLSGPSQTGFPVQASQPASMVGFSAQAAQAAPQTSFTSQTGQPHLHTSFSAQALPTSQTGFVGQPGPLTGFSAQPDPLTGFSGQMSSASQTGFPCPSPSQPAQPGANFYGNFLQQPESTAPAAPHMVASQTTAVPTAQYNTANFLPQTNPAVASQMAPQAPGGPAVQQHNNDVLGGNYLPQAQPTATVTSQPALTPSTGSLAIVPQQPAKKFEPKSSVWA